MIRFNARRFNTFLAGAVRQDVIWRRATACPCVAPYSGAALQDCALCAGIGWRWDEGVDAWCGITNMAPAKAAAMFGMWAPGDATLTLPADSPLYAAGQHDRIRLADATSPFSTVINPEMNPRFMGTPSCVTRVHWIVDGEEVDGDIPEIADNGVMTWPNGGAPPEGVCFTITGRRYDEMFVFRNLPTNRNAGVDGLPRKLPVRSFDVFGRSASGDAAN